MTDALTSILSKLKKVEPAGQDIWKACCPAHGDDKASLYVSRGKVQPIVLHCHAGCKREDILRCLEMTDSDICKERATTRLNKEIQNSILAVAASVLRNQPPLPMTPDAALARAPIPAQAPPAASKADVIHEEEYIYTDEQGQPLYKKKRFDKKDGGKFCTFERWTGTAYDASKGNMEGARRVLMNLPEVLKSSEVMVFEGERKARAVAEWGFTVTTCDGGANGWRPEFANFLQDKDVIVFPDEDEPGLGYARAVVESIKGKAASYRVVRLPGLVEKEDAHDWIKAGHTREEFVAEIQKTPAYPPQLSMLTIMEIISMDLPEDDNILGDRIIAEGETSGIVGPGAIGKSRIVLNLMMHLAIGKDFGPMKVHRPSMRCMMFQTENGMRRLQDDLMRMIIPYNDPEQNQILDSIIILCPLTQDDVDLTLANDEVQQRMKTAVRKFKPGLVVFDPLIEFYAGDNENDALQMKATLAIMERIAKAHSRKTALIAVHHAPLGKQATAAAFGLDRATYGRGAKSFYNRVRAQINIIPGGEEENPPAIIACGKNNNGKYFSKFALKLDEKSRHYNHIDDFDFDDYIGKLNRKPGQKNAKDIKANSDLVLAALTARGKFATFKELIEDIKKLARCERSSAIKGLQRAEEAGLIQKDAGIYSIKRPKE